MSLPGILVIAGAYVLVPLVQAWVFLSLQPFADALDTLNFAASIVAYHWLLNNVILGLKIPVFQRTLPYDLRIRIHVWSTLGLVVLVGWHGVYTIFLKVKEIDAVTWTLLGTFAALLILSALWIPLPGLKALRARVVALSRWGLIQSYDWLKAGHKLLFLVLASLTYVHILLAEIVDLVPPASAWGYHLLLASAAGLSLVARLRNRTLPSLTVRRVQTSGGIVRLTLTGHPRLRYRAGQFAFLRFDHPRLRGEEHPFSFTSAPHEPEVGFAARSLGDFTAQWQDLKPGDTLRINGGFGAFAPRPGTRPLGLIGSGIGAAPLVSLLKDLSVRDPGRRIVCLLSVNTRAELLDPEDLEKLRDRMPHLTLKTLVFDEDQTLYDAGLFEREFPGPGDWDYYLCSSDKVRGIVAGALRSLGVRPGRIHFEAFSLG